MKLKINLVVILTIAIQNSFCQNTIIGSGTVLNSANVNDLSHSAWYRGGNFLGGVAGSNNVFGTLWNSSIYHHTNNTFKMKLNGDYSYAVNGFFAPRNGFLLIGQEQPVSPGITTDYLQNKGAFSRLHLHDNLSTGGNYDIESGYRPWMRNGIYFSGFSDAGYLGQKANTFDNTDMIFTWSDNSGNDNMTFAFTRFHGLALNNTTPTSGDLTGEGINGREVMRFAASGNIGMGPRFNATFPPANDLHIRSENMTSSFIQIDNQEFPTTGPTATTFTNGSILGILGNNSTILNSNLLLYNQENRHILIGTNTVVNPSTTTPTTANEKVRITSVGAPTNLAGGGYGVNNPFGRPLTDTYVSISGNPFNNIKRPYSILQLGDDMDISSGLRNWMYTGTMVSRETDHLFVGLKNEGVNQNDAVIAWGDDDLIGPGVIGPDNLRFIFTETTVFGYNTPATDNDGTEVGRFVPSCNGCPVQKPSFGIGDFSPTSTQPWNTPDYVGATLDIDGDLRIRTVTQANLNQVLVIDPGDKNRVHYRDINGLYNSNNGIYNSNNLFQWGVSCNDPNFATNVSNYGIATDRSMQLTADFHFFDPTPTAEGRIGIGSDATTNCTLLPNRLVIEALGPNQSGVRLKDLTYLLSPATFTPANVASAKYLTVDDFGDIILANLPPIAGGTATADNGCSTLPAGNVQFGNDLGNNTADLLNDREVNMVNNNIYFKGQAANNTGVQNAIGLGYNILAPGLSLRSKLSVIENSGSIGYIAGPGTIYPTALYFPGGANKQNGTEAISGINKDINSVGAAPILQTGVYGESSGSNTGQGMNAGGHFYATNGNSSNVGVLGVAISTSSTSVGGFFVGDNTPPSSGVSVGAWGRGLNSNFRSYGVRGEVFNPSLTAINFGIYGTAPVSANNWAGYFEGNVHVNGTLTSLVLGPSDQLLKTVIDTISNASQIISQLIPRTFYFDTTNVYGINLPSTRQYGFVAQEVEPVLPELVSQIHKPEVLDSLGNVINPSIDYKTLNYDAMIALLMKGMQEQQTVIENLTTQLNDLNAIVNNCCSQGNNLLAPNTGGNQTSNYQPNVHQTEVRLTDNYCVLGENSPNPFRDHTVINYELAETIQSAQIVFYNMVGQIIKVLEINDRGLGRLNVYGDDLRSGMYSYSLIVDGNVCETKKMIKE